MTVASGAAPNPALTMSAVTRLSEPTAPRLPGGFLDRILAEHARQGWSFDALDQIRMEGEAGTGTGGDGSGASDGAGAGSGDGGSGTQSQPDLAALQTLVDGAKKDGESGATAALLKALGVEKIEDAQAIITAAKETERKNMSEAERLKAEAEDDRKAAAAEKAEAGLLTRQAALKDALAGKGLKDVAHEMALGHLQTKYPVGTDLPSGDELAKVVDAIAGQFKSEGDGTGTPGNVPGGKPAGQGSVTGIDAGRERARQARKGTEPPDKGDEPIPGFRRVS